MYNTCNDCQVYIYIIPLCTLHRPNWVKMDGITYQKACTLPLRIENDHPEYGRVEDMFIIQNRVTFFVTVMETSSFNTHFHAYVINSTTNTSIILHTQLFSPIPMHIHRLSLGGSSVCLIVCKHHICGICHSFHLTCVHSELLL